MTLITYWKNLNEREQWLLGLGGIFCIIYLFYLVIYSPLTTAVADQGLQLQDKRDTLIWMQKIQQQYRKPSSTAQVINNNQLLSLIAKELSAPKFKPFTYQLQQTGSTEIQLNFEKVPYNAFINWLWQITHHYAIEIKELHIEETPSAGIVKLSLLFSARQ